MINDALFKHVASNELPASMYQMLEPHLDSLLESYRDSEAMGDQLATLEYLDLGRRFRTLRAEFEETRDADWPAFARENWPEIDEHFTIGS